MMFNGLLTIFDIRNVTQWAYLFTIIRIPVKKLQHIVSSILGLAQLTKSRSENVLITLFLGYKTLDSNVMGTSIMESFLYGLQNVIV